MKKNHRPTDNRRDDDRSKRNEPHRREGRSSQGQRLASGERIPFKGANNRNDASDAEADNRRGSGPSHREHHARGEDSHRSDQRPRHSAQDRKPFRSDRNSDRRLDNERPYSERRQEGNRDDRKPSEKDRRRENHSDSPRSEGRKREWTDDNRSGNRRDGQFSNRRKPFVKGGGRFDREERPRAKQREDGSMRLNRFIAHAGICSRREADSHITAGLVKVNGKVITEMGYKVQAGDEVRYNDSLIRSEKKVYVLLNKPKGFITTVDDPKARKTVMDLVGGACKERIYPVGRLDRQTTGVLLFTNDGELADKLLHPSKGARKIYEAVLDKPLTKTDLIRIEQGLELEDGLVKVDTIAYVEDKDRKHIGLELHVGKNRIVRRIFEHLGYEVTKLDRVSFAGLTKKRLSRGQYRFLTEKEVEFLRMR